MTGSPTSDWEPAQYHRFQAQRQRPFLDLLDLIGTWPGATAVDLGCGSGELTRRLHESTGARHTLGIDSSPAMLAEAARDGADGAVSFRLGDIASLDFDGPADVVCANAALQWVPDHPAVLARWAEWVAPGGMLAVQVPSNVDHPVHQIIAAVLAEAPFAALTDPSWATDPTTSVLTPESYSEVLHDLGFARQHVRLQIYDMELPSTEAAVEWIKGTNLTRVRKNLPPETYDEFLERYTHRLVAELGQRRPFFYPFKRILFAGWR